MIRVQLEQLNVDGLQEVARQQTLDTRGTRAALLDRLIDHFDRNGWLEQIRIATPSIVEGDACDMREVARGTAESNAGSAELLSLENTDRRRAEMIPPVIPPLNVDRHEEVRQAPFPNMQEIVQALMRAMEDK